MPHAGLHQAENHSNNRQNQEGGHLVASFLGRKVPAMEGLRPYSMAAVPEQVHRQAHNEDSCDEQLNDDDSCLDRTEGAETVAGQGCDRVVSGK